MRGATSSAKPLCMKIGDPNFPFTAFSRTSAGEIFKRECARHFSFQRRSMALGCDVFFDGFARAFKCDPFVARRLWMILTPKWCLLPRHIRLAREGPLNPRRCQVVWSGRLFAGAMVERGGARAREPQVRRATFAERLERVFAPQVIAKTAEREAVFFYYFVLPQFNHLNPFFRRGARAHTQLTNSICFEGERELARAGAESSIRKNMINSFSFFLSSLSLLQQLEF